MPLAGSERTALRGQAPRATVVIPAYRRTEVLERAVRSALAQDLPPDAFEVVVVDSSSSAETAAMIAAVQRSSPCRLRLETKSPEGPGPSRNLGAALGHGAVIAFLDSDCEATPAWLRSGLNAFDETVGIVQGRVIPDPSVRFGVFAHSLAVEREGCLYETANIFYRREAFEAAGGFRSDLTPTAERPTGGEDVELAWAVKRRGWRTCFCEDALVYHEVVRAPVTRWLFTKQLFIFPLLVRRVPELRRFFFARYFYDAPQAALLVALAGVALSARWLPAVMLILPYCIVRGSERTKTLRGPLRVVRVLAYFLKDLTNCATLVAGSVRYRRVLI